MTIKYVLDAVDTHALKNLDLSIEYKHKITRFQNIVKNLKKVVEEII